MSYESRIIRSAAALIKDHGHSRQANARDARGRVTRIASAESFSLYGAVSRASNAGDVDLQTGHTHRDLWKVLTDEATARMFEMGLSPSHAQHPVFALNDVPGFNQAAAVEFLTNLAEKLEKAANPASNGGAA